MYCSYAVSLFIVVSGFSLMLSITKNNLSFRVGIGQFFKRRVLRILPTYYFAILFSLKLLAFIGENTDTHWDLSVPVDLKDVITQFFNSRFLDSDN
jgi:peptidoglycan/LPS O-acetylase OafA/YrhL